MPKEIKNLSTRPVFITLNSNQLVALSPGETSRKIRNVDLVANRKILKLEKRKIIQLKNAEEKKDITKKKSGKKHKPVGKSSEKAKKKPEKVNGVKENTAAVKSASAAENNKSESVREDSTKI